LLSSQRLNRRDRSVPGRIPGSSRGGHRRFFGRA